MIYFDNIIFSLQRTGGISVVWYELLKRYMARHRPDQYRLIEDGRAAANMFRPLLPAEAAVVLPERVRLPWIGRYLDVQAPQADDFLFHSSYYRICNGPGARNITTVHDFTYEYYSRGWRKTLHCRQKYRAIRQSELVVCISESTRADLLRFVPDYPAERVRVVYNGISDSYRVLPGLPEENLPYPRETYALYVGARDGYKNFALAVQGLAGTGLRLVIAGSPLNRAEQRLLLQYLGKAGYYYAGRVTNDRLNTLYNGAYALLYPSAYEGFGIPVLEAQQAGCPVVACRASSIPEIIGSDRLLMDRPAADELRRKLEQLRCASVRKEVVEEGLENVRRFSWDRMYAGMQQVYDEVAAR